MPTQKVTDGDRMTYSRYRLLLLSSVPNVPDPSKPPPKGSVYIYDLLDEMDGEPRYIGQTCQALTKRAYSHVYLARRRAGSNAPLEALITRLIAKNCAIIMRIHAVVDAGEAADLAERERIASLRAAGIRLLNQGPGGERAPAGRLVPPDERQRAAAARRARQRSDEYRRHQSAVASLRRHAPEAYNRLLASFIERGSVVTREALCREHHLPANAITVIMAGRANDLLVDPILLARAREVDGALRKRVADGRSRMMAAARACADGAPDRTIAQVAAEHRLSGRRLAEAIRRGHCGIHHELRAAIRARAAAQARHRGRALGRRARRTDRRQLRWLLEAYARGARGLTLAVVAQRLGVTQAYLSHLIANRTRSPLPRDLVRRCRVRALAQRGQGARSRRRLTDEQLREARRRLANGERLKHVAADLGVSSSLLNHALCGRSYRDVTDV
jgi:AraC-like DNA-binding protein